MGVWTSSFVVIGCVNCTSVYTAHLCKLHICVSPPCPLVLMLVVLVWVWHWAADALIIQVRLIALLTATPMFASFHLSCDLLALIRSVILAITSCFNISSMRKNGLWMLQVSSTGTGEWSKLWCDLVFAHLGDDEIETQVRHNSSIDHSQDVFSC